MDFFEMSFLNKKTIQMNENEEGESKSKKMVIQGKTNRYQMKKLLTKEDASLPQKKRVCNKATEAALTTEMVDQLECIESWATGKGPLSGKEDVANILKKEIVKKINGYRRQDVGRGLYADTLFIDADMIIGELYATHMVCYYCKEVMYVLYDKVREKKQWTVDRVDNDKGHNKGNIVLSCLECNLSRRRRGKDAFLFTKQLHLIKTD
jgi:hypothetical protein